MNILARIASALATMIVTASHAQGPAQDLGFEAGRIGEAPPMWFVPTPGWAAELTEDQAAEGKRSLKLHLLAESDAPFGNVMHMLDAGPYRSRHVTVRARIRVQGEGQGQMWFRVDRPNGEMGAFDNMGDRPIRAGDWSDAVIEADVAEDAVAVCIGFISVGGTATLFIDGVSIARDARPGVVAQTPSPPRPLLSRGLENTAAAARLLGYVRYFNPTDAAAGVKAWNHFAVDLFDRAEPAADAADLARRLAEAVAPLAPTLQVWAGGFDDAPQAPAAPSGATETRWWKHYGAGTVSSISMNIYRSRIVSQALTGDARADAHEEMFVLRDLGGGVACRIPVEVYADVAGTLPHAATPEVWASSSDKDELTALNRSTRLAGVALAWGVFQHFYPYFDVVETDWDAALTVALAGAADDADELEYLFTLRELVAKLHDGHGHVTNPALIARSFLPLAIEWHGGDLIVVGKAQGVGDQARVGDVIVSIDGRSAEECYQDAARRISAATDGWRRHVSARALTFSYPTGDPVRFGLRGPDGAERTATLARSPVPPENTATSHRPANGADLGNGITYFDLNGADGGALDRAMPALAQARGIIFDLRGYPGDAGYRLMEHLIGEPATSARWLIPVVARPDRQGLEWDEAERWALTPEEPRLRARIAFLTDGRAISYAESIMGIVEEYKLGDIVGSTTAGTNGNVNPIELPGGYTVSWTGMKVLKHDGSRHHGVGIAPTVPVVPTAKGIAEGRDEVLEKAVEVLKARLGE